MTSNDLPASPQPEQKASGVVAIIGRPNAGKSSLMNRLLKTKLSIVSPKAQTTRDQILGILDDDEKGQMVLLDTPGIHAAKEGGVNEFMMGEVQKSLDEPDLVWYLVDPKTTLKREETVLKMIKESIKPSTPVYLCLTKSDVRMPAKDKVKLVETLCGLFTFTKTYSISSNRNKGITELLEDSWKLLPKGAPLYQDEDAISDRPVKFFVAEMIREQLFYQLGEELPYCCAILIKSYKENEVPIKIEATICVERDSQKGMVIGKAASKIKSISMRARETIEEFLETKVVLVLKVDVLKDWSRDENALKKLGYQLPKKKKKK